ncbi:MAG: PqqD family protein [Lachnospiraceae bacterium]|nr:PqqD family protein [Lachnospiraceae bacterium]
MKLKKGFITHSTGTESLLVSSGATEFSGLVKGNKTLGVILDLLKTDTTEEALIDTMYGRFEAPREVIAADVKKALSELRKIGALDE